jgi:hypothetical protein
MPTSSSSSSCSLCLSFTKVFYKGFLKQDVINRVTFPCIWVFVGYFFLTYPMLHFLISHANCPNELFLPFPAPHFEILQVYLIYFPKWPSYSTTQNKIISVCRWKGPQSFWMLLTLWRSRTNFILTKKNIVPTWIY